MKKKVLTRSERRALREAVEWILDPFWEDRISGTYPDRSIMVGLDLFAEVDDIMDSQVRVADECRHREAIAAQLGCERLGW